ncbi:hypothetical protein FDP41_003307 [Naegleria fowleri]|uniref:Vps72/YL1 C-terminal domain-containing protein n=1 Tax=Naegleria fowleri TaxID=5763 RepID=A0A6A5BXB4_NAEFO|nr:uncharacterized protein FDP41_003307 [Naegleria fowleri]KAF0977985.1 hypothetical protein FDP41_003307 [Naegleria fowleri]CAG4715701.1 unnamed protein product [Naegleria fowleri]
MPTTSRKTRSTRTPSSSKKASSSSSNSTSRTSSPTPNHKRSVHQSVINVEEEDEEFLNHQTSASSESIAGNIPSSYKSYDIKQLEAMRARIALLERDNYVDRKGGSAGKFSLISGGDYEEGIWDTTNDVTSSTKTKSKKKKKDTSSDDTEPTSKKRKNEFKDSRKKSVKFVRRKLDHVLLNLDKVHLNPHPNYFSIAAAPSIYPPRKYCYTTGFLANYTCPHTGKHFINIPAYEHIKKDFQLE